jgi:hypothetical protein
MSSLLERAQALEKSRGKAWDPKVGEAVAGKVVEVKLVSLKFGERTLLAIEAEGTGERIDVWCPVVLERQLHDLGVKVGDSIGVKYLGIPEGKKYKDYGVIVEVDPAAPDEGIPF